MYIKIWSMPGREEKWVIQYKGDILARLKAAGYSTYVIREKKLINETALQNIRGGKQISWAVLGTLCDLLGCQPGDILENRSED